jgi:peptidylprolyl isomerase
MNRTRRAATVALALAATGIAMTGCSGSSKGERPASTVAAKPSPGGRNAPVLSKAPAIKETKSLGIAVTGGFGKAPDFRVPSTEPPKDRGLQVLHRGSGSRVSLGQVLVANYQIRTWGSKTVEPQVLDDSFARHTPVAVVVGARQVVNDWDAALVGQPVGSRVLLTLPATGGASTGTGPAAATGRPMVVVVDILGTMAKDATASGSTIAGKPGMPEVVSGPDHRPQVRSVDGVKATTAVSELLVGGTGSAISGRRILVLHVLQVDASTGRTLSQTWGANPMLQRADQVQSLVPALIGARVGSRAVALVPAAASGTAHPQVLVVDVLGQV